MTFVHAFRVSAPPAARASRQVLTLVCLALGIALAPQASAIEAASPPGAESDWDWRLAGVVLSPDLNEALFVHADGTRKLREGEVIDGWTLAAIRAGDVTLQRAGVEKRLNIDQPPAGEGNPAPTAASGPPDPPLQSAQAVRAAARQQQKDQKAAEALLTAATKQMQTQHRNPHDRSDR